MQGAMGVCVCVCGRVYAQVCVCAKSTELIMIRPADLLIRALTPLLSTPITHAQAGFAVQTSCQASCVLCVQTCTTL